MKRLIHKIWQDVPEQIRVPVEVLRRVHYWNTAGAIFVHVPKAAGVSVSRAIYSRPLGHFKAIDIRRVAPRTFNSLFTFGVVRHPLDRLISAYRFAKAGGTFEMGMKNPKDYVIDEFRSFDSFLHEWLVNRDPYALDGVFKPQHCYLCDDDQVIVDLVIYFENIERDIAIVGSRIGRRIELTHNNKTLAHEVGHVDKEAQRLVEQIYAKDYDIFGFDRQ